MPLNAMFNITSYLRLFGDAWIMPVITARTWSETGS